MGKQTLHGIFTYIWSICVVHVGEYTIPIEYLVGENGGKGPLGMGE